MIRSFRCKETEKLFGRQFSRKLPPDVQRVARRKLEVLDAAEKLLGKREGQHSIRINDQWRICFRWREGNAYDVEIVDYH